MKVLLALVIAVLSAIESLLLAALYIGLFVQPGGSGEFQGINQTADLLLAYMILPPLTFVIVFFLVVRFHSPKNHKYFRTLAWGLAIAVAIVLLGAIFSTNRVVSKRIFELNPVVLAVSIGVIIWQRITRGEEDSFQAGA